MGKRFYIIWLGFLLCSTQMFGLGPHEVVLLVNENSSESVAIGAAYAKLRHIPDLNIIKLKLPIAESDQDEFCMSPADFTTLIWDPAIDAVKKRGIEKHSLVWVYSVGFPVQISGQPPVSILGLTFLRNRKVSNDDVDKGLYISPLFAGRNQPRGGVNFPQTFDVYAGWLGNDMPLPCMMLGYIGKRGNTSKEIMECLKRGVESDATKPDGSVYFVTSDDIRSTCREWQFPYAKKELEMMRIKSFITNAFPRNTKDIIGVLMGSAHVDTENRNTYLSGAMCEHLTSAGAVFNSANQTKTTEWIRSGATASAGTVTEPYSIWSKFPDARFFVYYVSGCSMVESFYQSIRCPLQSLMIGDPLAQPWAPKANLALDLQSTDGQSAKIIRFTAEVYCEDESYYGKKIYLIDGKWIGEGASIDLDAEKLSNGEHLLRVVAYRTGMVRCQVFVEKKIVIKDGMFEIMDTETGTLH